MYFKKLRNLPRTTPKCDVYHLLNICSGIDMKETLTDCFYIRDHRRGKGEKDLGRLCFNWIADHHPLIFIKIMKFIPEYGRWDDFFHIKSSHMKLMIYNFIKVKLDEDVLLMKMGLPISVCAKWMPSEGRSYARHHKREFESFLKYLQLTPKQYRNKISILRKCLNLPETLLCNERLDLLNYSRISQSAQEFYTTCLKNKDTWCFNNRKQKVKKKISRQEKNTEFYESIITDLNII